MIRQEKIQHFICQICTFKNRIRDAFLHQHVFVRANLREGSLLLDGVSARLLDCTPVCVRVQSLYVHVYLCAFFVSLWLWHASMCVSACKTKQISCTQLRVRSHKRTCSPKGRLKPEASRESNSSWKSSRGQTQSGIIPSNTFTQNLCKWFRQYRMSHWNQGTHSWAVLTDENL